MRPNPISVKKYSTRAKPSALLIRTNTKTELRYFVEKYNSDFYTPSNPITKQLYSEQEIEFLERRTNIVPINPETEQHYSSFKLGCDCNICRKFEYIINPATGRLLSAEEVDALSKPTSKQLLEYFSDYPPELLSSLIIFYKRYKNMILGYEFGDFERKINNFIDGKTNEFPFELEKTERWHSNWNCELGRLMDVYPRYALVLELNNQMTTIKNMDIVTRIEDVRVKKYMKKVENIEIRDEYIIPRKHRTGDNYTAVKFLNYEEQQRLFEKIENLNEFESWFLRMNTLPEFLENMLYDDIEPIIIGRNNLFYFIKNYSSMRRRTIEMRISSRKPYIELSHKVYGNELNHFNDELPSLKKHKKLIKLKEEEIKKLFNQYLLCKVPEQLSRFF